LVILGSLLLVGCASFQGSQAPVTVPQIIQMSQEKVTAYEIIKRIHMSGTVYRLDASQITSLREQGVSDPVINHMQRTYLEAVRKHKQLVDRSHWTEVDGWWYGGRPYGWSDD
jgi:hypothetical protein